MFFKSIAAPVIGAIAGLILIVGTASASPALTLGSGKLLSGPGTDYASLGSLPAGAHVDLVWCGTRQNWCLIKLHSQMGWVPATELNAKPGGGAAVADTGGPNGGKSGQVLKTSPAGAAIATEVGPSQSGGGSLNLGGPATITLIH